MKREHILFTVVLMIGLLLLLLQFSYKNSGQKGQTSKLSIGPKITPSGAINYDSTKAVVKQHRIRLKTAFDKKAIGFDSIGRAFTNHLVNDLFPYWYGTTWDFNGYTAVPKKGAIACGYFVSTTLVHCGVNLNRYKMAQKSSMDGALMLEVKDSLYIKHSSRDVFLPEFKKIHKNGLYMVGLSNHVGYLHKQDSTVYFIHSSYVSPVAVVIEDATTSVALGYSTIFVVADITYNEELMRKWLNGTVIPH